MAYVRRNNKGSAKYSTNFGQSVNTATYTVVDFEDKLWDDDNAVTTGASWKWTAPKAGRIYLKAKVLFAAGTDWTVGEVGILEVRKNTVQYDVIEYKTAGETGVSQTFSLQGSTYVDVAAGEEIDLRVYHNTGATQNLAANNKQNYIIIKYE